MDYLLEEALLHNPSITVKLARARLDVLQQHPLWRELDLTHPLIATAIFLARLADPKELRGPYDGTAVPPKPPVAQSRVLTVASTNLLHLEH